jgi:hypothetical protein
MRRRALGRRSFVGPAGQNCPTQLNSSRTLGAGRSRLEGTALRPVGARRERPVGEIERPGTPGRDPVQSGILMSLAAGTLLVRTRCSAAFSAGRADMARTMRRPASSVSACLQLQNVSRGRRIENRGTHDDAYPDRASLDVRCDRRTRRARAGRHPHPGGDGRRTHGRAESGRRRCCAAHDHTGVGAGDALDLARREEGHQPSVYPVSTLARCRLESR